MTYAIDPTPLWQPTPERAAATRMAALMRQTGHASYADLWQWSVDQPESFWTTIWDFCGAVGERGGGLFSEETETKTEKGKINWYGINSRYFSFSLRGGFELFVNDDRFFLQLFGAVEGQAAADRRLGSVGRCVEGLGRQTFVQLAEGLAARQLGALLSRHG